MLQVMEQNMMEMIIILILKEEIDEMIKEMVVKRISLFCLKITGKIDKMFQIFKDIYEEKKPKNTLFQFIDNIEVLSFSDEIIICLKNLS